MAAEQNDFFAVTTSDFEESESENENEENTVLGKRANLKENIPKSVKNQSKQSKLHNSYNVVERFLYHPSIDFSNLSSYLNCYIEVKIEACYLNFQNPKVKANKLFGSDYYTSNSDFVAVFLHSEFFNAEEFKKKTFMGISVTFFVIKLKRNYTSSERNGIMSKKLNIGNTVNYQTIKPVAYKLIQNWKLEEVCKIMEKVNIQDKKRVKIVPEKKDVKLQPRFNNLVFNMNNELAIEYNIINLCEKSNDSKDYLSNLLKKYYMIIETNRFSKFVLTAIQKEQLKYFASEFVYKVLQIKNAFEFDNEHFSKHKLSPKKYTEIIKGISWEDIVWSEGCIKFKNMNFEISEPASFKFYKIQDD